MPSSFLTRLFGLSGQTAVVIGGTGVLGGAIAAGLAQAGAAVMVAGREPDRGRTRVDALRALGAEANFSAVDVTSRDSIQTLLDATLSWRGQVDMLVNCAGANSALPYEEISDADWARVIDSQLTATHLACQCFAPLMATQKDGGSILNIGSVTAHLPLSRVFAYSAAKAAVVNLTKNLAREYATRKVRVNVLCPGFFPAEQNRKILDQQRIDNILNGTPMHRFGKPEELIGAALLLLSRTAGSYLTGADLYVDGGFTAARF